MADEIDPDTGEAVTAPKRHAPKAERIFLVVVDDSPEMKVALRFACRRAEHTGGRVALLYVIPKGSSFGHWMSIEDMIEEEAREEAEQIVNAHAETVTELTGQMPAVHIRDGMPGEELVNLIEEDQGISVLVLATSAGGKGPGPLIQALTGKRFATLRVPLTLVPGTLTDSEIDALT